MTGNKVGSKSRLETRFSDEVTLTDNRVARPAPTPVYSGQVLAGPLIQTAMAMLCACFIMCSTVSSLATIHPSRVTQSHMSLPLVSSDANAPLSVLPDAPPFLLFLYISAMRSLSSSDPLHRNSSIAKGQEARYPLFQRLFVLLQSLQPVCLLCILHRLLCLILLGVLSLDLGVNGKRLGGVRGRCGGCRASGYRENLCRISAANQRRMSIRSLFFLLGTTSQPSSSTVPVPDVFSSS